MASKEQIVARIFDKQDEDGFWKVLPKTHPNYHHLLHYSPTFSSTLWTLVLLADIKHAPDDPRLVKPLQTLQEKFFDENYGIFTLKKDHFPIPCLNGNMIYLDCYFNGKPSEKSLRALEFFAKNQRFDDGCYVAEKNEFCSNKSCYGKHTCYWSVTKLLKGISFVPQQYRTDQIEGLLRKCIDFVLLHQVCYSSRSKDRIMVKGMDLLTFPNMYKSDFLEILWLLKREKVNSPTLDRALALLKSKQTQNGEWHLEKKVHNMATSVGAVDRPNQFVTSRAQGVIEFYF